MLLMSCSLVLFGLEFMYFNSFFKKTLEDIIIIVSDTIWPDPHCLFIHK